MPAASPPTSPGTQRGELTITAQLDDPDGLLLRLDGVEEDDAEYFSGTSSRHLSLAPLEALCRTLATGEPARLTTRWRKWSFRHHYSFDPPWVAEETRPPAARELWFYPMRENRRTFRARADALIPCLRAELDWLVDNLAWLDDTRRGPTEAGLQRALRDLRRAAERCALDTTSPRPP
ncbi:MAG: hypothetical protein KC486_23390 [Myxococcales bacterium]|nr:hypothetical protein [Myxococcales bacterium]